MLGPFPLQLGDGLQFLHWIQFRLTEKLPRAAELDEVVQVEVAAWYLRKAGAVKPRDRVKLESPSRPYRAQLMHATVGLFYLQQGEEVGEQATIDLRAGKKDCAVPGEAKALLRPPALRTGRGCKAKANWRTVAW